MTPWPPYIKFVSLTVLWLLLPLWSVAQEITIYHKKYGTEHGLPSSEVYEALQDSKGYMWFCTDAGVSRYDGYEFRNFSTKDGLTNNTVFHIYEDYKGRIWFLPYNSQLCYFENDSIYHYKYNEQLIEALPFEWIRAISIDSNDVLTFSGVQWGFGQVSAEGVIDYQLTTNSDTGIVAYYEYGNDLIVYALNVHPHIKRVDAFMAHGADSVIEYINTDKSIKYLYEYRVSATEFIIAAGLWVLHYKNGKLNYILAGTPVVNVYVDQNGAVWLASVNEGIRIYNSIEEFFLGRPPLHHLFVDKNISDIFEDRTGSIWLAIQNNGLYYIPNPNPGIKVHVLSEDELTNRVSGILVDEDKLLYVGTFNSKIYQINSGELPKLQYENVISYDGTIYNFRFELDEAGNRFPIANSSLITVDDSTTWTHGFWGVRSVVNKDTSWIFRNIRFNQMLRDQQGRVWAGTNSGLFIYENGELKNMNNISDFFSGRIEDLGELDDGTLVIASKDVGIILYNEPEILHISEEDGLSSDIVRDVHVDDDQDIWVATSTGLNWLTRKDAGGYDVTKVTTNHGLSGNEVNAVTAIGGVIWAATNNGVVEFNKNAIELNNTIPVFHFTSVSINETQVGLDSTYQLRYNENYIEIGFIGLSYRDRSGVVYKYRMSGVEDNWIETRSRLARYPALGNGSYTFQIQTANSSGQWSAIQEVKFRITPPYWEKWWFITLCTASVLATLVLLFRYREKRQQKKAQQKRLIQQHKLAAVQAELKALRAQMNPHFTFNTLSAIQTAVNNADTMNASKYIGDFAALIRRVLENSRHATIKLENEVETLKLYMELEQLRFSSRFTYAITVDPNLDTSYFRIPSMVIQPYVENAIIHGLAPKKTGGRLSVIIKLQGDTIVCVVQDNGIGRDQAMKIKERKGFEHHSMGMEITEGRMDLYKQEIGEEFSAKIEDLFDKHGKANGTKVELIFPV